MMKCFSKSMISIVLLFAISFSANSFEFDEEKAYAGGGLGLNSLGASGFDSAIGYQFFAGYNLKDDVKLGDKIGLSAELGYTSSGKFSFSGCQSGGLFTAFCFDFPAIKGLWTTAVFDYTINAEISALARVGLDMGNDSGLMFGGGAAYQINEKVTARLEYVIRDSYNSLQANAVYSF